MAEVGYDLSWRTQRIGAIANNSMFTDNPFRNAVMSSRLMKARSLRRCAELSHTEGGADCRQQYKFHEKLFPIAIAKTLPRLDKAAV